MTKKLNINAPAHLKHNTGSVETPVLSVGGGTFLSQEDIQSIYEQELFTPFGSKRKNYSTHIPGLFKAPLGWADFEDAFYKKKGEFLVIKVKKEKKKTVYVNHNLTVLRELIGKMKENKNSIWSVYSFVSLLKGSSDGYLYRKEATVASLAQRIGITPAQARNYKQEALKLNLIRKSKDGGLVLLSKKPKKKSEKIKIDIKNKSVKQIETAIQASILKKNIVAQQIMKVKKSRSTYTCNSLSDITIMSNKKGADTLGMSDTWFSTHKRKFISEGISFRRNKTCLGIKTSAEVDMLNEKKKAGYYFISKQDGMCYVEMPSIVNLDVIPSGSTNVIDVTARILSRQKTKRRINKNK